MHPRMLLPALLLLAALGGAPASGAGNGTFTLSDATALVGQDGATTLALDSSWDPPAAEIWLTVRYDPDVIRYGGARFTAGGTASATRTQAGTVLVQLVDTTAGFRSGPLADLAFSGLRNGSSGLEIELQHVRAYPDGRPVEITDSARTVPGRFTVLAAAPVNETVVATATPAPLGTPVPTTTATVRPPRPTLPPTTVRTPAAPPTTVLYGDDYTGAASPTPTPAPAATAPAPNRTIAEIAAANPDFSVFVNATRAAGLFDVLDGPGPLTAFVPTDAAFAALPPGTLDGLLEKRTALDELLRYHLAPGTLTVADVTARALVPTLLGEPLRVAVRPGGAVGIDGANLTLLDIPAANGMVHIVDGVLVPPGSAPTATPAPTPSPPATTLPAPTTRAGPGGPVAAGGGLAVAALLVLRRRR